MFLLSERSKQNRSLQGNRNVAIWLGNRVIPYNREAYVKKKNLPIVRHKQIPGQQKKVCSL